MRTMSPSRARGATFRRWAVARGAPRADAALAVRYGVAGRIQPQPFVRSAGVHSATMVGAAECRPLLLTLAPPPFAERMLRNLSFGATPASRREFELLGSTDPARLANWVDWQLDWTSIEDSALDARIAAAGYLTLGKPLAQLWADHVVPNPPWEQRMQPAFEVQRVKWMRAAYSRRQLREVVVDFWHDHFNVFAQDFSAGPVFVHYDRDVIRANALGNFRTMLEAVATSTSMLYYLDNYSNTRTGPNENWARELMELHTLGAQNYYGFQDPATLPRDPVDASLPAGYTDIDVYEVARAFTGWSVRNAHWQFPTENDGTFVYRPTWHDTAAKTVLGLSLPAGQADRKDGRDVLDRLAAHPATARHICTKLVRRFVSDRPSESLVASAAEVFLARRAAPDQMVHVLRHILNSDEMFNAWGEKTRRPFTAVVAAMRAGGSDWSIPPSDALSNGFVWMFRFTGHEPFSWPAPNGFPDVDTAWAGSNTFAMLWKIMHWLVECDGKPPIIPVVEVSRANVPTWTAQALVDYWCQRMLGYLPDPARRQVFLRFMAQNGDPASYVILDNDVWAGSDLKRHYNQARLKTLVALIMLSPEFLSR